MKSNTPITDAATHDDWSGGAAAVKVEVAKDMERRLAIIACDAAAVRNDWLDAQPPGIGLIIRNIRRHANLLENDKDLARRALDSE
jgi:hypothetical protein